MFSQSGFMFSILSKIFYIVQLICSDLCPNKVPTFHALDMSLSLLSVAFISVIFSFQFVEEKGHLPHFPARVSLIVSLRYPLGCSSVPRISCKLEIRSKDVVWLRFRFLEGFLPSDLSFLWCWQPLTITA